MGWEGRVGGRRVGKGKERKGEKAGGSGGWPEKGLSEAEIKEYVTERKERRLLRGDTKENVKCLFADCRPMFALLVFNYTLKWKAVTLTLSIITRRFILIFTLL